MTDVLPAKPVAARSTGSGESNRALLGQLMMLALPLMAENILHMIVGLTDTYLANHLDPAVQVPATAAIGTMAYFLWFIGLMVSAIGAGSTAIIARAKGARHRSLANSVSGQSVTAALVIGGTMAGVLYVTAPVLVSLTRLSPEAQQFALIYLRILSLSLPFSTVMFVANACLRGAGDTITPAVSMIVVDTVNIIASLSLTRGYLGMPAMGFKGIAIGTFIAYVVGGLLLFAALIRGRGGVRLHLHRLRPHWLTLKRILRIGIPAGAESVLTWIAQFAVVIVINSLDKTSTAPAAHINAIRIESLSYLGGFAFAMAATTMVGQSLGMRNPGRATRSAYLAYAVGGGFMAAWGLFFIAFGWLPAQLLTSNPAIADLTARCLFVCGFVQAGFAASAIFGGAMRGAGDTFAVMALNLLSIVVVRLTGVLIVGLWLKLGLVAVWVVLCIELMTRGLLMYWRFSQGKWKLAKV